MIELGVITFVCLSVCVLEITFVESKPSKTKNQNSKLLLAVTTNVNE